MTYPTKDELLQRGQEVAAEFCRLNDLETPTLVQVARSDWQFDACAYYRRNTTTICVAKCSAIGTVGRQWSYPGYTVDRTPYGVIQHELGHHVDFTRSTNRRAYFGNFSIELRAAAGEQEITSYCPNDAEWFAEMFRVFVTNPDLLRQVRPRTHEALSAHFKPVFTDGWRERLAGAPDRTIAAVESKLRKPAGPKLTKVAPHVRPSEQTQEKLL